MPATQSDLFRADQAAIEIPAEVQAMIDAGALVVFNHSGGKDSQAMTALLRRLVPEEQIVVAHAHLPQVEWPGTESHARRNSPGLPFYTVQARRSLLQMARERGMFPGPQYRQCTSDLKRTPIAKLIRRLCRERGTKLVVNCLGERAEESTRRARKPVLALDKRQSKAGRRVLEWRPIHHLRLAEVFQVIAEAGQRPHWAYAEGMTRLSCVFCIMASAADLTTAARLMPHLYRVYALLERFLDFTLSPSRKTLEEITGVALADLEPGDPTGLVARALAAPESPAPATLNLVALAA